MSEDVTPVKRPRGNPNFGKKKPVENKVTDVITGPRESNVYRYEYVENESDVWLKLYSAVLSTYNSAGPAICKAAAANADCALAEYKARYKK